MVCGARGGAPDGGAPSRGRHRHRASDGIRVPSLSRAEWFRRTTWTREDAAEFEDRLGRSRSASHKAQYLRIQALHLHEVGTRGLTEAALGLLDQLIAKWPVASQLAAAQMLRAECLIDLGRPGDALQAYRAALDAQRTAPNWRTDAHLGFGELVVALRRAELYEEALAALEEFGDNDPFPAQQYSQAVTRALIAESRSELAEARRWARVALEAAASRESPFRRHKGLGLVRYADPVVYDRLVALQAK